MMSQINRDKSIDKMSLIADIKTADDKQNLNDQFSMFANDDVKLPSPKEEIVGFNEMIYLDSDGTFDCLLTIIVMVPV